MATNNYEPEFQDKLNRVKADMDIETQLALLCEKTEIQELFAQAAQQYGDDYAQAYQAGFWAACKLVWGYMDAVGKAAKQKYDALGDEHDGAI